MSSSLGMATAELQPMDPKQSPQSGDSLWKEAWKRLLKDKVAIFGGIVILMLLVVRAVLWAAGARGVTLIR